MSFLTAIGGSKGGNKRKFIDGVNSEECQVSKFKFSPLPLSQNSQENQNDSNYEPYEKETRKSYKPTIVFEETRRRGQNIEAGGPSTSTQNNDEGPFPTKIKNESMDTENGPNPMKTSLRSKLQNFAAPRKEKEEDLDPIDQWLKMQAKTLPARDRFKDFVPNQPIVGKSSLANVPFSMMTHNQRERAVKENMGKPIPNYKKKHDDDESEDIKEIEDNNAKPASRQTNFASHNQQRVGKSSLINIPTHLSGKPLKENLAKPIPNYRKKFMKDKEESEETNQDDNTNNMQAKTCTVRPQFKTAHQLALASNVLRKNPGFNNKQSRQPASYNPSFKSPLLQKGEEAQPSPQEPEMDERLKNLDPQLIEKIENEIILHNNPVDWKDIAGLDFVKKSIKEIVVLPLMRPDIFHGLRAPPQGLLLFGPPGTGKTMIAKCIAAKSGFTFFSISSSSLTSKWIGEGEKMVRTLFAVARVRQPSVVFIDEIDSILSSRSDSEHESSRRMKTEFLVQLDGASSSGDERILIVGATNRPQDLDEAARRRLVKRLYVPLPEKTARASLINNLLATQNVKHELDDSDYEKIAEQTEGYSGADMHHLCREAAMGPIRSQFSQIEDIPAEEVRAINYQDFEVAMSQVKASVSDKDLQMYLDWNKNFGSTAK